MYLTKISFLLDTPFYSRSQGWLGHGDFESHFKPKLVESLVEDGCEVKDVQVGDSHMAVLTTGKYSKVEDSPMIYSLQYCGFYTRPPTFCSIRGRISHDRVRRLRASGEY